MRVTLLSLFAILLLAVPTHAQSTLNFANPVVYPTNGWSPASVAIADVNGDGKPDLVVTNSCVNTGLCESYELVSCVGCDGTVAVFLGVGDGTFQPAVTYDSGGYGPSQVVVVDVNGDGKPDIVVANQCVPPTAPSTEPCSGNNPLPGSFGVLLGNGDGTFRSPVAYTVGGNSVEALAVADVNGDGKPDVVLSIVCSSSPCSGHSQIYVSLGNGDGTFRAPVPYDSGGYAAQSIAIKDVNGDGYPDIVTANNCSTYGCPSNVGVAGVLLGNGDGTFRSPVSYPSSGTAFSIAVADVNGDGKPDLLVGNFCAPGSCSATAVNVDILVGKGDGTFQSPVNYTAVGFGSPWVTVADVDGDGKPDLIVSASCNDSACDNNGTVSVLSGNGDGTFRSAVSYDSGGPYATFVATADVNGDAKPDIVVVNSQKSQTQTDIGAVGVLLNITGTSGPIASLSSNELTFAATTLSGPTAPQSVTLSNAGNVPFAINNIQITGADSTAFSQTNTCGASVAANANCTISVIYTPGSNASTATLKITDGTPGSPHTVSLTGNPPATTQVSVSPSSLTFDSTQIGIPSTRQQLTVQNIGTAALYITQITTSGDFTALANCSGPVLFGTSCIISVTFDPTAAGTRSGTLSIVDNASGGSQTISLTGTGYAEPPANTPGAQVSPSTVTFPSQYVGTSGLPQTVTVTNTGNATLTITAVTASPADFGALSNCTNPVAPNASCTIGVFFDPTVGGPRAGTLSVSYNGAGSPQTVALTGSGQDFSMAASSTSSATISAGQTATYSVALAPTSGFAQNVALNCAGGPAMSTCSVTPSSVSLSGTAAKTVTVSVATSSQGFASPFAGVNPQQKTPLILLTSIVALVFLLTASSSLRPAGRLRWAPALGLVLLACLTMTLTSCGGGSSSGASGTGTAEAGTYTVTVTGNFSSGSANITHATKLTLVVK
jgi:hypothetical protein